MNIFLKERKAKTFLKKKRKITLLSLINNDGLTSCEKDRKADTLSTFSIMTSQGSSLCDSLWVHTDTGTSPDDVTTSTFRKSSMLDKTHSRNNGEENERHFTE